MAELTAEKLAILGITFSFEEAKELVEAAIDKDLPILLYGPPGIGKSTLVRDIAKKRNIGFIDLRLSQLEPTDLLGIPRYQKRESEFVGGLMEGGPVRRAPGPSIWSTYAPPVTLPFEGNPENMPKEGILFLDEINLATPATQHAAFQLVLDKRILDRKLMPGWKVVAAGNRPEFPGVTAFDIPSPLANRFLIIEVKEPTPFEWAKFAEKKQLPEPVISCVASKDCVIYAEDDDIRANLPYATPRSWEMAGRLLKGMETKTDQQIKKAIRWAAAAVGAKYAKALEKHFKRVKDILDEVLNDPNKLELISGADLSAFANKFTKLIIDIYKDKVKLTKDLENKLKRVVDFIAERKQKENMKEIIDTLSSELVKVIKEDIAKS